ncbi:hypothetical protein [cf. Phormidesmis sp. LEGE 11477]|uniref:hypothetical protein n=1 Tax=cf. Phormidesmis sp. LEGE 11477 TaxID=1828680 RepID=UPI00188254A6|nr:hypothetical protein [cf. Phormidesmis sp. LEGE 11477]MBE9064263.1 hypothetical protein [cf. Phormidesmis sp. LEGE 11477]
MSASLATQNDLYQKFDSFFRAVNNGPKTKHPGYCAYFSKLLSDARYSPAAVIAAWRTRFDEPLSPPVCDQWLQWLDQSGVFRYSAEPYSLARAAATALQPADTVLQPDRVPQLTGVESSRIQQTSDDVVPGVAQSPLSFYLLAQSGCGKSTLQRAIARMTLAFHPRAQFFFIDLQAKRWLGFECDPAIVTYATPGIDEDMLLVTEAIKRVWGIYQARTSEAQRSARSASGRLPEFHPVRLFFNEWNLFFGWAAEFKGAKLKSYYQLAKHSQIEEPLSPAEAISRVRHMFGSGREQKVSLGICGQELIKETTGFGPQTVNNINLVATGLISPAGDGGYSAPLGLAKDAKRIPDERVRDWLKKELDSFVENNWPVILSTQGHGRIGKFEDYSRLDGSSVIKRYQHTVTRRLT